MLRKDNKIKIACWAMAPLIFLIVASTSLGQTFLSPDVPVMVDGDVIVDRDVCNTDGTDLSLFLSGDELGIDAGVNLTAFGFGGPDILFAVDVPTTIDEQRYTPRQIIGFDGSHCSVYFDGAAGWIPEGATFDAVAELPDGRLVFSLDVPVMIGSLPVQPNDLISIDLSSDTIGMYFDGQAEGLPQAADIDGVWVRENGDLLFSLDIPVQLGAMTFSANDVIQWDGAAFSLFLSGEATGLPRNVDIDALALSKGSGEPCPGDFEPLDGDVDGSDLAKLVVDTGLLELSIFAEVYGRTDCPVSAK